MFKENYDVKEKKVFLSFTKVESFLLFFFTFIMILQFLFIYSLSPETFNLTLYSLALFVGKALNLLIKHVK